MRRVALTTGLLLLCSGSVSAREKADRIFVNGRVWTGEDARPWAEALAVRGTTILAVGTSRQIRGYKEDPTDVVDLKGRLVIPGFNDAHVRFVMGGLILDQLDLREASAAEVQKRLAAYAKAHPDRVWIVGRDWSYGALAESPHRRLLDAVVADRPVWLRDRDGHSGWANTKALESAGITRLITKDPDGGVIVRDEKGEPTGLLKESAMALVGKRVPPPGSEDKYRAVKKGLELAASYGLTSVQDAGFDEQDAPLLERILDEGALKVRFYCALPLVKGPSPELLARYRELRDRLHGPRLRFGAVKGMLDGVVDERTAAMLEPYVGGGTGLLLWSPEELRRAVALFDAERFQVMLHAVGDKAIRTALDAFEHAARTNGTTGRRHRVEDVEVPAPADRARFKALGVVASTQALFSKPDATTLDNYAVLLGPERSAQANAFKLWDDAGVVQAFGSDWPVFSF